MEKSPIQELINKFPEGFEEMLKTNAYADKAFRFLLHKNDPYEIIFWLLKANEDMSKTIDKLANYNASPVVCVTRPEALKNLKL